MKLNELIAAAKAGKPKILNGLDDKRIARVVQTVLAEAVKKIADAKDGKIDLKGFGRFVVKQTEVEKDGQKVMKKRIMFRPARPAAERKNPGGKKGGKGGGKGAGKGGGKGAGKGAGAKAA